MKICFSDKRQIQVSHRLMIKKILITCDGNISFTSRHAFFLVNIVLKFFCFLSLFQLDVFFCCFLLFDERKLSTIFQSSFIKIFINFPKDGFFSGCLMNIQNNVIPIKFSPFCQRFLSAQLKGEKFSSFSWL